MGAPTLTETSDEFDRRMRKRFDAPAYEAAESLFTRAYQARKSLKSLIDQISDSCEMLGSPMGDGMPRQRGGENAVENRMVEHADLMQRLTAKRDEYKRVLEDCERVIDDMLEHGEGDGGDASFLRYRFMQGLSQAKAAKKSGYSESHGKEKGEIALVHASAAVRRLGLI